MHKIHVRPISGQELAKQQPSAFDHSSPNRGLTAIHSINSYRQGADPARILMLILVGCMSIVVCGCGGLVVNQGTGASPTKSKGKSSPLSQISCGTTSFTGPQTKACSVYLNSPATAAVVVYLQSNNPAITVPSTATAFSGSNSAGFYVVSAGVSSTQSVTLTASAGPDSTTTVIQLYPAPTTLPNLSSISCGTQSLTGPQTKACSVYLNAPATSPISVSLASNNPAVMLPRSVTVGAGATTGGFSVTAAAVSTSQTVTLTASAGGVTKTDILSLNSSTAGPPSGPTANHEVDLSWDAASDSADQVVGYNIFRTTGTNSGYLQVNSLIDTVTTFADTGLQSGQTYSYVVTSVDAAGVESPPSNTTSVTIP